MRNDVRIWTLKGEERYGMEQRSVLGAHMEGGFETGDCSLNQKCAKIGFARMSHISSMKASLLFLSHLYAINGLIVNPNGLMCNRQSRNVLNSALNFKKRQKSWQTNTQSSDTSLTFTPKMDTLHHLHHFNIHNVHIASTTHITHSNAASNSALYGSNYLDSLTPPPQIDIATVPKVRTEWEGEREGEGKKKEERESTRSMKSNIQG